MKMRKVYFIGGPWDGHMRVLDLKQTWPMFEVIEPVGPMPLRAPSLEEEPWLQEVRCVVYTRAFESDTFVVMVQEGHF